jgi:hypothetical protein
MPGSWIVGAQSPQSAESQRNAALDLCRAFGPLAITAGRSGIHITHWGHAALASPVSLIKTTSSSFTDGQAEPHRSRLPHWVVISARLPYSLR